MSFLDNLTKKVGDAAKTAAKKSEGFVETTKLNMAINSDEGRIKAIYTQIGELMYKRFKEGSEPDEELAAFCNQIKEIEDNITNLKEKIDQIKASTEQEQPQQTPQYGQSQQVGTNYTSQAQPSYQYSPVPQPVESSQQPVSEPVHPEPQYIPVVNTSSLEQQEAQPVTPVQKAFCQSCGAQVPPDGKFCTSCGTKL